MSVRRPSSLNTRCGATSRAATRPNPNLEAAVQPSAVPVANMHRVTGTFADPSHESAFAAQLFHMAYPTHVLLMALTLAYFTWNALVQPEMRAHWAGFVLCGLFLGWYAACYSTTPAGTTRCGASG